MDKCWEAEYCIVAEFYRVLVEVVAAAAALVAADVDKQELHAALGRKRLVA